MRNFAKLLFQRVVIVSLCLLVQLGVLFLLLLRFSEYFPWYKAFVTVLSLVLTLFIVSGRADPAYKLAWIIPILALPLFGVALYLILGNSRHAGRHQKNIRRIENAMQEHLKQDPAILDRLQLENSMAGTQAHYLLTKANCPIYINTATEYFPSGEACYERMLEDLRGAPSISNILSFSAAKCGTPCWKF